MPPYVGGINMTVDDCTTFTDPSHSYEYGGMTNCIFTEDDSTISTHFTLKDSDVYTSGTGVYQTVGAASYYLVNGSTNRGGGTASIDPVLLSDLQTLTTYPPVVLTNGWLTSSTNLSPQVERNTNTPDRGYHYPPIDYAPQRCRFQCHHSGCSWDRARWMRHPVRCLSFYQWRLQLRGNGDKS